MTSTLAFICISVTVLITSFISGILGMAGGMILMGVLLALLSLPAAMMLHGITQMASNGWRAWLWRTNVKWRVFRGYAYGAFLAVGLFALVELVVSKPVAYVLLGITPFVSFVLPKRLTLNV
ncbi:MAG: sulfite exporter TauE/SafE family protein, partial [Betaproteobacteria bacterium]